MSLPFYFDAQLANEIGLVPAIVLQILRSANLYRKDKTSPWVHIVQGDIAMQYPFLTPNSISESFKILKEKRLIETARFGLPCKYYFRLTSEEVQHAS